MAKKLISYDDQKPGLGLPDPVKNALDGAFAGRDRSTEALPLTHVTITPRGSDPIPTDFFDDAFWGANGETISRSTDGGITWEQVATVPGIGLITRLIPTADGELIVGATDKIVRSTGWGTGSPAWTTVLPNPTASFFHPWGIKGDGQKFIVLHYSGSGGTTPDRADSRYAWISTDQGRTWDVVWDSDEMWGAERAALTHLHAAEYDPWEDRFFIAEGHEPDMTGVYVSYDDGVTWDRIPYGPDFSRDPGNSPTVIEATDYGVVMGTDDPTNGIIILPRGVNEMQRAYSRRGVSNTTLFGYAHMGARDPRTGQVYLVWELNEIYAADMGAQIMASDGRVAGPVWEDTETARRLWRRITIDDRGNLLAWEQVTNSVLRARIQGVGVIPAHRWDTGRVLGGEVTGNRGTVALGSEAVADGNGSVAVGKGRTNGAGGVAIGLDAESFLDSVAVGQDAVARDNGTSFGRRAKSTGGISFGYEATGGHASSSAIGRRANAQRTDGLPNPGATAIGFEAKATAPAGEATAIGRQAEASGDRGTAVGSQAKATSVRTTVVGQAAVTTASNRATVVGADAVATNAVGGVALGAGAQSLHTNSVALGTDVQTTLSNQVHIGPRHMQINPPSTEPSAPTVGAAIYTRVVEGKTQLVARFPTGHPVIIDQEL